MPARKGSAQGRSRAILARGLAPARLIPGGSLPSSLTPEAPGKGPCNQCPECSLAGRTSQSVLWSRVRHDHFKLRVEISSVGHHPRGGRGEADEVRAAEGAAAARGAATPFPCHRYRAVAPAGGYSRCVRARRRTRTRGTDEGSGGVDVAGAAARDGA